MNPKSRVTAVSLSCLLPSTPFSLQSSSSICLAPLLPASIPPLTTPAFLFPSSTLSSPSFRPFCPASVSPFRGHPPCHPLSRFPDPCLCPLSSASPRPTGPLRPGSDDAGVLVPQPLCPPHCTARQEDTAETQHRSPEAQSDSLATGLKPDSPLRAARAGQAADGAGWPVWVEVVCVCRGGGCPSMGGCACLLAHPAKNTAGLKPDPPPSGLLKAAGSLTPGSLPTLVPWAQPLPPPGQDAKEAPEPGWPGQGIPVAGPEPGLALFPLPSVNPTAPPELPG